MRRAHSGEYASSAKQSLNPNGIRVIARLVYASTAKRTTVDGSQARGHFIGVQSAMARGTAQTPVIGGSVNIPDDVIAGLPACESCEVFEKGPIRRARKLCLIYRHGYIAALLCEPCSRVDDITDCRYLYSEELRNAIADRERKTVQAMREEIPRE